MSINKLFRRNKWIIIITVIVSVYFGYNFIIQEAKMQSLCKSVYNKKITLSKLDNEILSLNEDLKGVKSNENIERLAREKLKMLLEDEVLYVIEER